MAKEFFKNLPDTSTPLNASRLNGLLNGSEAMGSIVVGDVKCKNLFNHNNLKSVGYMTQNDKEFVFNGTSFYTNIQYVYDFKINQPYILSFNITEISTATEATFVFYYTDGSATEQNITTDNIGEYSIIATPTKEVEYAELRFFRLYDDKTQRTGKVTNIQIEEGTSFTGYAPYKEFGIESGSNSDGSWVKFEDGTMICRGQASIDIASFTQLALGINYSEQQSLPFPQQFISDGDIGMSVTSRTANFSWIVNVVPTTTNFVFTIINSATVQRNVFITWTAIGRWK